MARSDVIVKYININYIANFFSDTDVYTGYSRRPKGSLHRGIGGCDQIFVDNGKALVLLFYYFFFVLVFFLMTSSIHGKNQT